LQESGHYSIAGFFFQLLASANDALKLYCADTDPESLSAVFTVELFGQDGHISYPDSGRLRMIQYKYSSTGAPLEPSDLREILIAFKRSIEDAKVSPSSVDCYLTTNRPLSISAESWFEEGSAKAMAKGEFRDILHAGIAAKIKKTLPYTKFHPIFERLKYDLRDLNVAQTSGPRSKWRRLKLHCSADALCHQDPPRVCPAVRLGKVGIVVVNESKNAVGQVVHRRERHRPGHLSLKSSVPNFNLIQP